MYFCHYFVSRSKKRRIALHYILLYSCMPSFLLCFVKIFKQKIYTTASHPACVYVVRVRIYAYITYDMCIQLDRLDLPSMREHNKFIVKATLMFDSNKEIEFSLSGHKNQHCKTRFIWTCEDVLFCIENCCYKLYANTGLHTHTQYRKMK